MTIALLCALAQGTWAESENVTFNVRSWDATNKQVETTQTTKEATVLNSSNVWEPLATRDDQNDHYYVVKGNVSCTTLNCLGKVHLILCDGATLTCTGGILVDESNNNAKLHIYSQSDGDNQGKLIVTNSNDEAAGIGSGFGEHNGTIEIHGGNLDIKGGDKAAGIGAGYCSREVATKAGTIIIYGGIVKAEGGKYAAGIGGGSAYSDDLIFESGSVDKHSDGADFHLYGGKVTAIGGKYAAGVGGGGNNRAFGSHTTTGGGCGKCNIYGGELTAQGGENGAGIGGGTTKQRANNLIEGFIKISGGTVNATGGEYAAGIGAGGRNLDFGYVIISGGNVSAKGGTDAAGIGGGERGHGFITTISGGYVRAEGSAYGAGIGGGEAYINGTNGEGGDVTITGGTVIVIAGEKCKARENKGGSAIGCGQSVPDKDNHSVCKSLTFGDNMRVTAGDSESNIERVFSADLREPACRWRNYVKIEECKHTTPTVGSDQAEAITYTIDGDQHTMHCRYCAYSPQENHTFVENVCSYCRKTDNTSDDMWSVTLYRASAVGSTTYADRVVMKVVKGQTFTLPAVSATEGLTLMGYTTSWTENMGIEMKDNETTLTEVGTVVTPEADMNYYPRYRYRYVPTWTWNDADATATLSIKCSALSSDAVNVSNISYTTNTEGTVKTATGTYDHYGTTYTFTDTYLLPVGSLDLSNASSNEDNLHDYNGRKVSTLMLQGRTLYADGSWNTLCLPFSLSAEEVYTHLNPTKLKTLGSTSFNSETGTLTLNFIDATAIEAGKPYIIKWTSGGDRTNPSFSNVIIENVNKAVVTDYVTFIGFFSPVSLEANDKTVLYLGAGNKLYYPSAAKTVNACRAVFVLNGLTAGEPSADARAFKLNFGDESTGITTTNYTNDTNTDGAWYDMQGRRLSGKPSQHGIYIKNGKKVVIK